MKKYGIKMNEFRDIEMNVIMITINKMNVGNRFVYPRCC